MKSAGNERIAQMTATIELLKGAGVAHLGARDQRLDGAHLELGAGPVVHFGSCSYLGLELDERLKRGACEAIERFGVVFSSSRAYVSVPLFDELEELLRRVVGGFPLVVAASTSLAHQAALPVLVEEHDAVCCDFLAHSSLQAVLPALRERGVHCELIPHNSIDVLERRAQRLASTHRRVLYLCDGVYSMHGDLAPFDDLFELLERQPALFAYVDDAHGVGWAGLHGAGTVLGERRLHERMLVALGLSKSFGAGGAALVVPDAELARRIFGCGGPMIFSGPLQPAQLGAGIASARIHLSPELPVLQERLRARIELFDGLAQALGLECIAKSRAPIRFVEVGANERAAAVARALLDAGLFVNAAAFPAVPHGHAGVRLMLNVNHTLEDVRKLAHELAHCLDDDGAPLPPTRPTGAAYVA